MPSSERQAVYKSSRRTPRNRIDGAACHTKPEPGGWDTPAMSPTPEADRTPLRADRAVVTWFAVRALLLAGLAMTASTAIASDLVLFGRWTETLASGDLPLGDVWQYPPGMALLLAAVGLLQLGMAGLLVLILLADFGILLVVARTPGAMYWAVAPLLMGPLVLTRLDMVVTLAAILGLRPGLSAIRSGVFLGLGAAIKVWPATLVGALPTRGSLRRSAAALAVYITCAATVSVLFEGDRFMSNQGGRGLQIESVAAWPFLIAARLGAPVDIVFANGTNEISAPLADSVARCLPVASLCAVAWIAWVSWRRNPSGPVATRSLALVCLLLVTSRVLSPQFNVWILGLVALMLAQGVGTRSTVIASGVTALAAQAFYPYFYGLGNAGLLLQTVRVASLLWLTVHVVRLSLAQRNHTVTTKRTWMLVQPTS